MSLLIETIKLYNGEYFNLFYHQQRMNRSLRDLFGLEIPFQLETFLKELHAPVKGLYKCRIVYDDKSAEVEFAPYVFREINSLYVVEDNVIDYRYKYSDRTGIDKLFQLRGQCDDILITQKGRVTDTSYCNIVFKRNENWYTPGAPLLCGTMRQSLIDKKLISPITIQKEDIPSFQSFKLVNAMVGFDGPEIDVSKIVL